MQKLFIGDSFGRVVQELIIQPVLVDMYMDENPVCVIADEIVSRPEDCWIDTTSGEIKQRTDDVVWQVSQQSVEVGDTESCRITGLEPGTVVTWPDGNIETVEDAVLELEFDMSGTYRMFVDGISCKKKEVTFEAYPKSS